MRTVTRLAAILAATALLGGAFVGRVSADTPSPSALTGKVTSQAEGAMEGVLVGAKKAGSTITTWVVSNAQGQYSFPRDRMEPGKYAISIRAVGYELPSTSVDVTAQPAQLDLQLNEGHQHLEARHATLQRGVDHERARRRRSRSWRSGVASTATRCSECCSLVSTRMRWHRSFSGWPGTRTTRRRCIRGCVRQKGLPAPAAAAQIRLRQVSELDQPERDRHV